MKTSLGAARGKTTIINAEELFGDFSHLSESQDMKDRSETYWEWPEDIGNGFISTIIPRPGIIIEIGNFQLRENIAISFSRTNPSVSLGFNISGTMKRLFDSNAGPTKHLSYTRGQSVLGCLPKNQHSFIKPSAKTRTCYVHIDMESSFLKSLFREQNDQMPSGLRNIIEDTEEQLFHQISTTPIAVNMAIQQIINCPYRSSLKRLFLEGKALELISYSLAQPVQSEDTFLRDNELRLDDIERVMEARDILLQNLETPPSLFDLARQVGTNKTTLNKGFRQTFGTSVFDYLRICRLERARELLDSKKVNVCEAAFHVGYTHQSSFARAFKNHFGTIPKDHLH